MKIEIEIDAVANKVRLSAFGVAIDVDDLDETLRPVVRSSVGALAGVVLVRVLGSRPTPTPPPPPPPRRVLVVGDRWQDIEATLRHYENHLRGANVTSVPLTTSLARVAGLSGFEEVLGLSMAEIEARARSGNILALELLHRHALGVLLTQ